MDIRLKASILSFACAHVREAIPQIIGVHIGVYKPSHLIVIGSTTNRVIV